MDPKFGFWGWLGSEIRIFHKSLVGYIVALIYLDDTRPSPGKQLGSNSQYSCIRSSLQARMHVEEREMTTLVLCNL